jgi:hypothetical protein
MNCPYDAFFCVSPIFLDLASAQFADSTIIIQVDQAGCHRAKRLRLPKNITGSFICRLSFVIWYKTNIDDYYAQLEADRIRVGAGRASAIGE